MDWTPYINRSRGDLLRLIAAVFALVGLSDVVRPEVLSRAVRSKVLYTLRPAESSLRRLIYTAALAMERAGYALPKPAKCAAPDTPIPRGQGGSRVPAFRLIDPRKRFDLNLHHTRSRRVRGPGPFISDPCDPDSAARRQAFLEDYARKKQARQSIPSTKGLCNRLLSLQAALNDIPRHAKRMLRLKARDPRKFIMRGPMRGGPPPGSRRQGRDEIDEVLRNCQQLAVWARDYREPG